MLSIIIPVYNVESFLDECLRSVENQTSTDFEVIIVNDGSTDNCEAIIKSYCAKNSNFRYYSKENGGLMSAYLFGIEKSVGDYIGFVDSDDFIEATFVEKMYNGNCEGADIVVCDRHDIDEHGGEFNRNDKPLIGAGFYNDDNNEIVYKNVLPPFSGRHITNARWNKIFRREIILQNLKYCESKSRIMEDRFFTPSCMFTAKSFKFIDDKLYFYRQRKSGSNHSLASPNLYNAIKLLMQTQKQMLIDKNLLQKYRNEYELACLNYLSLYIERNLLTKEKFRIKRRYSSLIINDDIFISLVKKHKKKLTHKKGFAIRLSFAFHSPSLLTLLSIFS